MKKSSKGALAAAAAGALLLGGAGSLAFWSDSATLPGVSLTAGELKLSDPVCTDWILDSQEAPPGTVVTASTLFVPGDVITQTCTSTVTATGDHLRATVGVTDPATTPSYPDDVTVESNFDINGAALTEITDADNGQTLTMDVKVTFEPTSGNDSQGQSVDLSDYVISLTQVHTPVP